MKFHKVPNEFRMMSDDGGFELFLLSTGQEACRHFRLLGASLQLNFDATLVLQPMPEWQVERIHPLTTATNSGPSVEAFGCSDLEQHRLIEQALSDFGYFFGDKANQFSVRFL